MHDVQQTATTWDGVADEIDGPMYNEGFMTGKSLDFANVAVEVGKEAVYQVQALLREPF